MADHTQPDGASKISEAQESDVRDVLQRVLASKEFEASERLQGLLRFVVDETLAGRGETIRGKTIALDFYGYDPEEIEKRENAIRVDVGRVRKRLAEYFSKEGLDEKVVITIPKGRYVPSFESVEVRSADEAGRQHGSVQPGLRLHSPTVLAATAVVILGVGVLVGTYLPGLWNGETGERHDEIERSATFEVSPKRLQAINLAEEGRDLIFPAVDPKRLNAAQLVFQSAIELDPTYAGSFAGLAQVQGIRSLLVRDSEFSARELESALSASDAALRLDPSSSWTHSATAWTAFAARDYSKAQTFSSRAVELDRNDPHILEFDALISLYSGNFTRVLNETSRMIDLLGNDADFVFRNARGSALFHTGDFAGALKAFEDTVAQGGPVSPVAVAYMMASAHRLGRSEKASQLAAQYSQNWPGQRVDLLFEELFVDPDYGRELGAAMRGAGWAPSGE